MRPRGFGVYFRGVGRFLVDGLLDRRAVAGFLLGHERAEALRGLAEHEDDFARDARRVTRREGAVLLAVYALYLAALAGITLATAG
jgi:hypothetical protein